MSLDLNLNRRNFLIPMAGILVAPTLVTCISMDRKTKFSANINKKVHWARRENWTGPEYVVGVAGMGDRYLMVKKRSSGWDFPGGPVVAKAHGQKTDENKDITFAVASYFNSQALISQRLGEAELFAYGFMINPATNENYLVHWFSMGMPQTFPTDPSPNLTETLDAKWATIDDPVIGKCLRMRIQEYTDAAEGGSVLKQSCFDYSV